MYVNEEKKPKVVILNKSGKLIESDFILGDTSLESVGAYNYLGVTLTPNCKNC